MGDYISLSLKLEDGGLHFPKPEAGGWGTTFPRSWMTGDYISLSLKLEDGDYISMKLEDGDYISLSLKLEDGGLHFPKPEAGGWGTTFP